MFENEVDAYCKSMGIERSSIEVDEFEIVSLSENAEVFFESDGEDNSLSLKPTIKCYIHHKNVHYLNQLLSVQPMIVQLLYGHGLMMNSMHIIL